MSEHISELANDLTGSAGDTSLSPKVKAMFCAVLELLAENRELDKLKVVDITSKAGIGKGTAYEYFDCKEQIIAEAIAYHIRLWVDYMLLSLDACNSTMEAVHFLFDKLIKYATGDERTLVTRISLMFMNPEGSDISRRLGKLMMQHRSGNLDKACGWDNLYERIRVAQKRGEIRPDLPPEYVAISIAGKVFTFMGYLIHASDEMKLRCNMEQMRELLLKSIYMELIVGGTSET